jgi:hypothetical protein
MEILLYDLLTRDTISCFNMQTGVGHDGLPKSRRKTDYVCVYLETDHIMMRAKYLRE